MNKAEKLVSIPAEEKKEQKKSFHTEEVTQLVQHGSDSQTGGIPVRKATVQSVKDRKTVLLIGEQAQIAKVAFSCLVQPQAGDIVLCAMDETGAYYILSIIDRSDIAQTTTLSFPNDVAIKTPGVVSIMSEKSVNLIADQNLNCVSKNALHQSEKLTVSSTEIATQGKTFSCVFQKMDIVSKMVHAFSERFMRKSTSYVRQTAVDDQVSAEQILRHAEKLCSVKSEIMMIKSEKDTFIDGDHVFTSL